MNRIVKTITSTIMAVVIAFTFSPITVCGEENVELTPKQKNAIEMLNYVTVLTEEINESKNSRVYMENAYSSLINNIKPKAVDDRTLNYMEGLLDTMERYRMIDVKRERLQYIYEQTQAQSMKAAIPNPMGLLSTVGSFDPIKLVGSVVYMAVDSVSSYKAYTAEAEKQYMQDGWVLDDEEAEALHNSRKGAFSYMVKMVNEFDLPDELTLTEDTVKEFVEYKNNTNVAGRIRSLETSEDTYKEYRGYWILLADSYYENGDYVKCIRALKNYENMGIQIFRKDHDLARVLPLGIASAKRFYKDDKYEEYAAKCAKTILNNIEKKDWALRYYVAQVYVDLYSRTKNKSYLSEAYNATLDNVNMLRPKQIELNDSYMVKVVEKQVPPDATKEEKKSIKEYNEMLEESRETEMPPIYEPLLINCELLFAIADEMKISNSSKDEIDKIIHPKDARLFLVEPVDDMFWFSNPNEKSDLKIIEYSGYYIVLPAKYLSQDASIVVSVVGSDGKTKAEFSDWKIDEVERETEDDINTYEVLYSSESAKDYNWLPGETVKVLIKPKNDVDNSITIKYKTVGTKDQWYNYLQVWQGQKNHWYDYAKVWENSVIFEEAK